MPPYDVTALRLEAARNLGFTAGFMVAQKRAFTGSLADYRELSGEQQVALSAEMFRLVRTNPEKYAPAQVAVAERGGFSEYSNLPQIPSVLQAGLVGAVEGLKSAPMTAAAGVSEVVKAAGSVVRTVGQEAGGVVRETAGSILGVKISTLAWVAAGGVFLYFVINSPAGARAAAYTVERVAPVRRNPSRRHR